MKTQHVAIILTVINLVVLSISLARMQPALAQPAQQQIAPVLRGRALEIVDSLGKIRASITIEPPVEVAGKHYPETVLLRLIDPRKKPLVKMTAAENGSALGFSDEADGGVLIVARNDGRFVKITDHDGKTQILKP